MSRSKLAFLLLAAMTAPILLWPGEAGAVPVFARKYGFACTMCHSSFPRLNDFGVRFRDNGYRLPSRESEERTVLQGPAPFAARVSGGYDYDQFQDSPEAVEEVRQFRLDGLDLLSAGLMARNIGYFAVYVPQIDASRGVAGQDGTLEMASVVFSHLGSSWLNVRAGRFEPAYVAFSVKRHLSVTPYEIYDFSFPGGSAFSDTQTGLELYGQGRHGLHYAVGWLAGADSDSTGANLSDDPPADVYARVSVVFGAGEGQTAGHRIGIVGYSGKARFLTAGPGSAPSDRKCYQRYGADASLNFAQLNLALQYLWGSDDEGFWGATESQEFSGGFAELTWQPMTRLAAFVRYDSVDAPDAATQEGISRTSAGARYSFADQLALHAEYSRATTSFRAPATPDMQEDFFTVRLDFAF